MKAPLPAVMFLCGLFSAVNSSFAQTWTPNSAPITNLLAIASSADGSKLAVGVYGGGIYTSTNSAATWLLTRAPSTNWTAIASSADGSRLVAASYTGGIYTSTDSGASWVLSATNVPGQYWFLVASSSDGSKLAAVDFSQSTPQPIQAPPGHQTDCQIRNGTPLFLRRMEPN